jgi:hypothetical protein
VARARRLTTGPRRILDVADELRVDRLIHRHIRHGKTLEEARDWVVRSDEANARPVDATRDRADLVNPLHRADRPNGIHHVWLASRRAPDGI